jgi:hypothetical protein
MADPQDTQIHESKLMERIGLMLVGSSMAGLGFNLLGFAY